MTAASVILVAVTVGDAVGVLLHAVKNAARHDTKQIHAARRAEVHGKPCRELGKLAILRGLFKDAPLSVGWRRD